MRDDGSNMCSEREKERGKRGFMRVVSLFYRRQTQFERTGIVDKRRRSAFEGEMVGSESGVPDRSYNNQVITMSL